MKTITQAQGKKPVFTGLLRADNEKQDTSSVSFAQRVERLRQAVREDKPQNVGTLYCWKKAWHNGSGPNG